MIIHQPSFRVDGDHVILWTRLEMAVQQGGLPEILWYRVPRKYAEFISQQSDAFLIPALLAGMHYGEDIRVMGAVSPRLAYNLDEYQMLLHLRMPDAVRPVKIQYDQLNPLEAKPMGVGASFSGGVDSLFTLWKHQLEQLSIPEYRITHALFIHGFDILMHDKSTFATLFGRYKLALIQLDIDLIPVQTNIVSIIISRLRYRNFYGPILAGSALVYAGLLKRFYIPSSRDYLKLRKRESSSGPVTDMLLSTETMEFKHDGATHQRVEKIYAIQSWSFAQNNLRVCPHTDKYKHGLNCSRCEKCVRTMLPLYAFGGVQQFNTFTKPFVANKEIMWWARKFNPSTDFVMEIFPVFRNHKPAAIPWLWFAALLGYLRYGILKIIPSFIKKWSQRYSYFINPLEAENAFEDRGIVENLNSGTNGEENR